MSTATILSKEERLDVIRRCRADPDWFFTHILGDAPWSAQTEIARSVRDNRRTAIKSCNGAGKTWTAARVGLWFLVCHAYATVVTTAPSTQQVEKLLWKEIGIAWRKLQERWPGLIDGRLFQIPKLEIEAGWLAYGFSTDDSNNFQGVHGPHVLFILDEAGGIKPIIWEPLEGNLVSEHTRLLAIGNPTDVSNPFFLECADPGTNVVTISAYDTPNFTAFGITEQDIIDNTWAAKITGRLPNDELITPEWTARQYAKYGPESAFYYARVKGQFPQQGTDSLLWMAWIDRAITEWAEPSGAIDFVTLGVDVAGGEGGGDESVISTFVWPSEGCPVQADLWGSAETDTMALALRVLSEAERVHSRYGCRVEARIDAVGIGKGVVDRLREMKRDRSAALEWLAVIPMMSGEQANDSEHYLNKRAEWWWAVRERLESKPPRILLLPDDQQRTQLTGVRYKRTASDVIQIERKADAKKRGIPSPDRGDATNYAVAPAPPTPQSRAIWIG